MTPDRLRELLRTLHDFEREVEFGDLPGYAAGNWSRRDFHCLINDIHTARIRLEQPAGDKKA